LDIILFQNLRWKIFLQFIFTYHTWIHLFNLTGVQYNYFNCYKTLFDSESINIFMRISKCLIIRLRYKSGELNNVTMMGYNSFLFILLYSYIIYTYINVNVCIISYTYCYYSNEWNTSEFSTAFTSKHGTIYNLNHW